jgi:protein dithiol oxidoreductase (disulfide-forming)
MINRRDLTLGTATVLVGAAGARAQGGAPVEGKDFVRLPAPAPVAAPAGKIEVVEFFSYGCPHCYSFEPLLEPWVKKLPADVAFRRVPAAFNASWEGLAKIFYALEASDQLEAMHKRVFAAIHVQRQKLDKESDIAAFVKSAGGDDAKFLDMRADAGHPRPLVHGGLAGRHA